MSQITHDYRPKESATWAMCCCSWAKPIVLKGLRQNLST